MFTRRPPGQPHLDQQNEALLFAGLPKHLHSRHPDIRVQGQGLQGREACRAPSTHACARHHLHSTSAKVVQDEQRAQGCSHKFAACWVASRRLKVRNMPLAGTSTMARLTSAQKVASTGHQKGKHLFQLHSMGTCPCYAVLDASPEAGSPSPPVAAAPAAEP